MQKLCFLFVATAFLVLGSSKSAAETNQVATNSASSTATNQVLAPNVSDAELQAQAKTVLHNVIIFGIVALVVALVVAGLALYGAYKKFGVIGAAVVALVLAIGVVMFGSFLLTF
jgi:hypothetical protein